MLKLSYLMLFQFSNRHSLALKIITQIFKSHPALSATNPFHIHCCLNTNGHIYIYWGLSEGKVIVTPYYKIKQTSVWLKILCTRKWNTEKDNWLIFEIIYVPCNYDAENVIFNETTKTKIFNYKCISFIESKYYVYHIQDETPWRSQNPDIMVHLASNEME